MSGILVPIAFFAMIAAVVIVPGWLRSQDRMRLHETLKASIEKGQPIPSEVIDAITSDVKVRRPPSPERVRRTGAPARFGRARPAAPHGRAGGRGRRRGAGRLPGRVRVDRRVPRRGGFRGLDQEDRGSAISAPPEAGAKADSVGGRSG